MPWNEPGNNGNKQQDPWGNKRDQNPPDLDKLISDFFKKLMGFFSGNKGNKGNTVKPFSSKEHNWGFITGIVSLVLIVLWFLSGFFIVNPAEEAVILRLGKYHEVLQPGLHWFARFIDTKYLVDIQKLSSFSIHGDFLTKSSEQADLPSQFLPEVTDKSLAVSSDQSKNLVNVELNVQYRISNPKEYLFSVVGPDETIKQVAEVALSDVIATMKLDDVLTTGRELLGQGVYDRVKRILNSYNIGLEIVAVTLKKVQAPDQVRAAFNDVNRADQDRATYIQQAHAYASKVVPLAQGIAASIEADANAYQQQVVLGAQANIAKYQALLNVYINYPDITRERMYLEAMQTILQNSSKILIDNQVGNNILYLPLDKMIKQTAVNDEDANAESGSDQSSTTLLSNNDLVRGGSLLNGGEMRNDTN